MHPILFEISGIKIHTYAVFLMGGFFIGLLVARAKAERYGLTKEQVVDMAIWTLIAGVLGARVSYIVQELPYYTKNPREIFGQFEGMTSFGGVIFGIPTLALFARKYKVAVWSLLDLCMVPALIGYAFGRVGCFFNGCCYGGVCELPWGIKVDDHPHLHHPAQLYETIMLGAFAFVVAAIEKRKQPVGRLFGIGFALMGLSRFVYEFWRAGTVEQVKAKLATSTYMGNLPITDAQFVALIMIAAGVTIWIVRRPRPSMSSEVAA